MPHQVFSPVARAAQPANVSALRFCSPYVSRNHPSGAVYALPPLSAHGLPSAHGQPLGWYFQQLPYGAVGAGGTETDIESHVREKIGSSTVTVCF